jgi:hypothetical protein
MIVEPLNADFAFVSPVILSGTKNLGFLSHSAPAKQMPEMFHGTCPEQSRRAQHDNGGV